MSQRKPDLKRIRSLKDRIAFFISSVAGVGLLPWAPGTWGTVAGIPLVYLSLEWPLWIRLIFWILFFIAGTWAACRYDEIMGTRDNQSIVVDEVIGFGVTAWFVQSATGFVLAFIVFRLFDILKPFPIRKVDRWSKARNSPFWSGFGVMVDDVLAGVYGLITLILVEKAGLI